MRFAYLSLMVALVAGLTNLAEAQSNPDRREFVQSSSPIANGGRVVSRSAPGQGVQIRAFESMSSTNPQTNAEPREAGSTRTALRPQATQGRTVYPYPANTPPRVAQLPTQQNAPFSSRNWGRVYNPPVSGQWTYRAPTAARVAQIPQNCNCAPGFQAPSAQPPASLAPTLTNPQGGNVALDPAWNTGVNYPPLQSPTAFGGTNAFQNWWNPLVSGSGAYQPIIRLQNMPPGTYLGQGIIGQPTAYVDGQPIRNLFHYISP